MDIVIPTRNDYKYLQRTINLLKLVRSINSINIIDNASDNKISRLIQTICKNSNCNYFYCKEIGKGNAIKLGIEKTREDLLFLDADIENLDLFQIDLMIRKFNLGYGLVKAAFRRSNGQSNSSFIIEELNKLLPDLRISRPTGGLYIIRRNILNQIDIPKSWSVDLSILIQSYLLGFSISEVDIGVIDDKERSKDSLNNSKLNLRQEINLWRSKNG